MSLNDIRAALSERGRETLLGLARMSIHKGLDGDELQIEYSEYASELQVQRASFVTLHVAGNLRGCIGSLEACQPLVVDVVQNAYAAAFRDPRFQALTWNEFQQLDVYLSILSPPEPMAFASEQELLTQLRPGVDGLILEEGNQRGTFLPAVWESLPEPRAFLRHLKQKAGLSPDYWSERIRVQRYTAESIP